MDAGDIVFLVGTSISLAVAITVFAILFIRSNTKDCKCYQEKDNDAEVSFDDCIEHLKLTKEFVEKYCLGCGYQRCENIGTEWFDGCEHGEELDNRVGNLNAEEVARGIILDAINNTPWAEDAYPGIRDRLIDAVNTRESSESK